MSTKYQERNNGTLSIILNDYEVDMWKNDATQTLLDEAEPEQAIKMHNIMMQS